MASSVAISACGSGHEDSSAPAAPPNLTVPGDGAPPRDDKVDIGADGAPAPDPYERYAHLCGGGCTPAPDGDASECAATGEPGEDGPPEEALSCQLVFEQTPQGNKAAPQCVTPGEYVEGHPCDTAADCGPGLGCVATESQGGVCRQYCCGNVEACAEGTYCAPQPMAEPVALGAPKIEIPACIPATDCQLLDDDRTCADGLTCTIVREDGTTSCVEPGEGELGDACPCAPGFVCSMLTNECKKLCRLDASAADCGAGAKCQGGSMAYPDGFGICVGGAK